MRQFRWFSAGPVPAAYDLRRLGWELLADSGHDPAHALLGLPRLLPLPQWLGLAGGSFPQRKWIMLLEVPDSTERARMLRMGFGDALDFGASLEELEYRVLRLTHAQTVNALGIAYSQVAGNHQVTRDAALTKRMQPGFAAMAALVSAQLARRGIRGAQATFEGAA